MGKASSTCTTIVGKGKQTSGKVQQGSVKGSTLGKGKKSRPSSHSSKIKGKAIDNDQTNEKDELQPDQTDQETYIVEDILDQRRLKGKSSLEYLIKWKYYPE